MNEFSVHRLCMCGLDCSYLLKWTWKFNGQTFVNTFKLVKFTTWRLLHVHFDCFCLINYLFLKFKIELVPPCTGISVAFSSIIEKLVESPHIAISWNHFHQCMTCDVEVPPPPPPPTPGFFPSFHFQLGASGMSVMVCICSTCTICGYIEWKSVSRKKIPYARLRFGLNCWFHLKRPTPGSKG